MKQYAFNERWDFVNPGDLEASLNFAVHHFLEVARQAIEDHGFFSVALSGGSTPKLIYQELVKHKLQWDKVFLFWSDERAVPPSHPDSNFHMAMKAGFEKLSIPKEQIFRMEAEKEIEENAHHYEELIRSKLPSGKFDLILLGMGEDGHTASLFPHTHGLHTQEQLVTANFVPKLECWRMSLTFKCINEAKNRVIYIFGKNKVETMQKICNASYDPDNFPIQGVEKALWILDDNAATFDRQFSR